jgi:hypothetical protein
LKTRKSSRIQDKPITISIAKANLISLAFFFPVTGLFLMPYTFIYGSGALNIPNILFHHLQSHSTSDDIYAALTIFWSKFFLLVILGVLIHELLHIFTWALFCKKGIRAVSIGFKWDSITPFATCSEPLKINPYRLGIVMPCIILGVLPGLVAIYIQNIFLLIFGIFFTLAATGDLIILWLSKKIKSPALVLDHPSQIGLIILK